MPTPSKSEPQENHKLMAAVVEEVDEAREVYELARQLAHALPLETFKDVTKAVGADGMITFRSNPRPVRNFADYVPGVLFPIDTVQKLVALLYETVRLAPAWIRYNEDDPKHAKRKLLRLGILGLREGVLGRGGYSGPSQRMAYGGAAVKPAVTEGES
jgi:hypothetical protein